LTASACKSQNESGVDLSAIGRERNLKQYPVALFAAYQGRIIRWDDRPKAILMNSAIMGDCLEAEFGIIRLFTNKAAVGGRSNRAFNSAEAVPCKDVLPAMKLEGGVINEVFQQLSRFGVGQYRGVNRVVHSRNGVRSSSLYYQR
jgi:hypothetical protein